MTEKSPTSPTETSKSRLRKGAEWTLQAGAGLTIGSLAANAYMAGYYTSEIPDPTVEKVAESLARHHINNFLTITNQDLCPPPTDPADIAVMYESMQSANSLDEIAERHKLTVVDLEKLYDQIDPLIEASSIQESTDAINKFTQPNMGLTIHTDQLADDDIELVDYKERLWNFMMIIKYIPTSLLDRLDIGDITIVKSLEGAYGTYNATTKEVQLGLDYIDRPSTIIHEIVGHGVHEISCQGYGYIDNNYESNNPPSYTYADKEWTQSQPNADYHTNAYATKNILEDVASTTEDYFTGEISLNLDGEPNPLDKKIMIILDRIDQLAPGAVEYLNKNINEFKWYERENQDRLDRQAEKNKQ